MSIGSFSSSSSCFRRSQEMDRNREGNSLSLNSSLVFLSERGPLDREDRSEIADTLSFRDIRKEPQLDIQLGEISHEYCHLPEEENALFFGREKESSFTASLKENALKIKKFISNRDQEVGDPFPALPKKPPRALTPIEYPPGSSLDIYRDPCSLASLETSTLWSQRKWIYQSNCRSRSLDPLLK